jgi:predicted nucleotide-binding protein
VNRTWLGTDSFSIPFGRWIGALQRRRDIFLGYCSSSEATARQVKTFLEQDIGAAVLDWKTDFLPAGSILQQIEDAAARCTAGVFLFTRDDTLSGLGEQAAPRDNVVFEAGYFAAVKGKQRVLIIRERGSKMPADLGGDIYVPLDDRADIGPIKEQILRFAQSRL